MLTDQPSRYWFGTHTALPFDDAVARVKTALQGEGFGILTEIDVRQTLKAKLDIERRPYVILGACNPSLVHQALAAEPMIGVLLPCNVIVYEDEEGTVIAAMDPAVALSLAPNPVLAPVAQEAKERLQRALAILEPASPDAGR